MGTLNDYPEYVLLLRNKKNISTLLLEQRKEKVSERFVMIKAREHHTIMGRILPQVQLQIKRDVVMILFLFLQKNICCVYLLEVPRLGEALLTSTHNICFCGKIKKNIRIFRLKSMPDLGYGHKRDSETWLLK